MDTTHYKLGVLVARCLVLACTAFWIVGCQTTRDAGINQRAANNVVPRGVDLSSFKGAAAKLVEEIEAKGVFNRYQGRSPIIGVSTVVNSSAERLDPALLTDVLMASMSDKARVMINRGMGADGKARYEDYMGTAKRQEARFREDAQPSPRPDLTLSGEFKGAYSPENKVNPRAYTIYLRLTDGETVVWQGHTEVMGTVLPKAFHRATGPKQIIGYVDEIKSPFLVKVSLGSEQGFSVGDKLEVIERDNLELKGGRSGREERVIAELELKEVREADSDATHLGLREIQKMARVRRKAASGAPR